MNQPTKLALLVLGGLGLLAAALLLAGAPPGDALYELYRGTLATPNAIGGTLRETTPLLIAGIAVFFALQAGLFNIGVEGQLLLGAITAAWIGLRVPGPLGIVAATLGGVVAGALWAFPAGWIRAYRGGHEVISTIILNNVALYLTGAIVAGPLRDASQESPTTATLAAATRIPAMTARPQVSLALLFGLVLLAGVGYWLRRRVGGYELRLVGKSNSAARAAGVVVPSAIVRAMLVSGAIGGFAGAMQVLAFEGRFYQNFSPGYGFDALGVALLAGSAPLALIPSALGFGILSRGSTSLSLLGVPRGITGITLGVLIIIFAAFRYGRRSSHG